MSSNQKPSISEKDFPGNLGKVIQDCSEALGTLSVKDRLTALRALAGISCHRIIPGLGLNEAGVPKKDKVQVGKTVSSKPQETSKKSKEEKKLDRDIKSINCEISMKSKKINRKLDEDDPLILKRSQLFRDLKGAKTKTPGIQGNSSTEPAVQTQSEASGERTREVSDLTKSSNPQRGERSLKERSLAELDFTEVDETVETTRRPSVAEVVKSGKTSGSRDSKPTESAPVQSPKPRRGSGSGKTRL
jgi:hypothetical protein